MLTFCIAIAVVGLGFCVAGRRGIRVNDHPICRRCRYDLVGREPLPEACPECGRVLSRRRAVRSGLRRRQPALFAFGLVLLLGAGGGGVQQAWGPLTAFDWYTVRPNWMLVNDANGLDTAVRDRAIAEVLRRMNEVDISRGAATDWVDRALDAQGDPNRTWDPVWAQLIECAAYQGWLDQARTHRYLEQAFAVRSGTTPDTVVPIGATVPLHLQLGSPRGPVGASVFDVHFRLTRAELNGAPLDLEVSNASTFPSSRRRARPTLVGRPAFPVRAAGAMTFDARVTANGPPGPATLTPIGALYFYQRAVAIWKVPYLAWQASAGAGGFDLQHTNSRFPPNPNVTLKSRVEFPVAVTLVRPEDITLPPLTEAADAALRQTFSAPHVTARNGRQTTFIQVHFALSGARPPAVLDAEVVIDGDRHALGSLHMDDETKTAAILQFTLREAVRFETVDVVLRPNLDAWRRIPFAPGILTAPIEFHDVPVKWRDAGN